MMGLIVGEAADKHAGEATASVRAAGFDAFVKMLTDEDTIFLEKNETIIH